MQISKLASAIYNDIVAGLSGYTSTPAISLEQLEDEVVEERLQIIKEYMLKGLVPLNDLALSINCVPLDCKSMDKCCGEDFGDKLPHFEIPQLINEYGINSIIYLGSVDKQVPFTVYTSLAYRHHNKRIRVSKKPYVYIDTTPNESNMYDGWVFNAPLLETISIVGLFKDPRQLEEFSCCLADAENFNFIDAEIKKRLTEKKLRYYRQLINQPQPNNQVAR